MWEEETMKRILLLAAVIALPVVLAFAQDTIPPPPTNLVAEQAPNVVPAAKLAWDGPVGSYGFRVYRATDDDAAHFQVIGHVTSPVYFDYAVRLGHVYKYYVTTVALSNTSTAILESEPSNIASISFASPEKPTGVVAGTVTDDSTGKPIRGISILFYRTRASITAINVSYAITDSLGQYSAKLDTGTYRVKAQPAPWMPPGPPAYLAEWYDNKKDMGSADPVVVIKDASVPVNFGLSRPGVTPVLKGTIAGTVIDDSAGLPIRGILIRFYRRGPSTANWQPTAITDSLGSYSATLDTGTYYVRAEGSIRSSIANVYKPEWFDNAATITLATPISVTPGSAFTANFGLSTPVMPNFAYIEGTVTDTLGNALRGATVVIRRSFQDLQGAAASSVWETSLQDITVEGIGCIRGAMWTGKTDSLGKFKARVLANHNYVAIAAKWGYLPEYYDDQTDPLLADVIVVTANVSGIDFTLAPNPVVNNSISGVVRDSAGTGVPSVIVLFPISRPMIHARGLFGHTDSAGAYIIAKVPAGDYIVLAVPYSGYAPAFYKAGAYGVLHWRLADTVHVTGDVAAIDIGVVPIYSTGFVRLHGRIMAGANPIPGVRVVARTSDGVVVGCGLTESNGYYSIDGVPVGSLIVEADYNEYTSSPSAVTVTGNQLVVSGVDFTLQTQGTTEASSSTTQPTAFVLQQNYPNPFNPATRISYTVGVVNSQQTVAGKVRLSVYDLLGREVALLVDEQKNPGTYTVTWDAAGMATGVYFYKFTVEGSGKELFSSVRKMLLVR
jgi:5-hydroxyisourate hydrolase-like protein (transthyretin family)